MPEKGARRVPSDLIFSTYNFPLVDLPASTLPRPIRRFRRPISISVTSNVFHERAGAFKNVSPRVLLRLDEPVSSNPRSRSLPFALFVPQLGWCRLGFVRPGAAISTTDSRSKTLPQSPSRAFDRLF